MPKIKKTKKTKDEPAKVKINNKNNIVPKYTIPFYSKERWQNWMDQVKESKFKIEDQEKCEIFVNMTDDVVLACLKLISKYDKGLINKEEANKYLSEIKEIVMKKIGSINEDTDAMLESTQTSLMGVFASCEIYINKPFGRTKSFGKLISDAIQAEEKNDIATALDIVATIGANVLSGESLSDKDFDKISFEGFVAEWLDGIDCISVAMLGDTSYKNDEPDTGD